MERVEVEQGVRDMIARIEDLARNTLEHNGNVIVGVMDPDEADEIKQRLIARQDISEYQERGIQALVDDILAGRVVLGDIEHALKASFKDEIIHENAKDTMHFTTFGMGEE